ncbi:MAG: FAD-binding protein, partial [Moorella sp. (in: Bacteria)]|nr:FAD-binding protein [Moorella sp. (in: firmicutes)]
MFSPKREFIARVREVVGPQYVETRTEELFAYSYDASFGCTRDTPTLPAVVVRPANKEEISKLMQLATEYRVPVVPRGAGSNNSGGTLPVEGCMVLETNRLNRILELDKNNLTVRVQPGVITGQLHRVVEAEGLFYPPDPASLEFCTIGGNLAECAGGPRGVKYGVTRDYVLQLEAVLADGTIIKTGTQTIKGVTGYDLTRLMVGSEGTLAVFTEALLRLIPLPKAHHTILAVYDDIRAAADSVSAIIAGGIVPACLEFMDRVLIKCVEEYTHVGLPTEAEAVLLLELDGHPAAIADEALAVEKICRSLGVRDLQSAADEERRQQLWAARRAAFPAIVRLRPNVLTEDVVVPRDKFADMVMRAHDIGKKHQLFVGMTGHAGDGNLHIEILTDENDDAEMERVQQAVLEMLQTAVE